MGLAATVIALGVRLFLLPASDTVVAADAVVVLPDSGQAGLQEGLGLVNAQVSSTLVVLGGAERIGGAERLCTGHDAVEVLCPAVAAQTREQARALAALVAERGWTAVVLVAARTEISRDTLQVSRCTEVTLLRRAVSTHDALGTPFAALAAVPSYLRALVLQEGC